MADMTSTGPGDPKRASGPKRDDRRKHVHIIHVPVEVVLTDMRANTLGNGPVGPATLTHVAKHIGAPEPTDIVVFNKQPWHFAGPGSLKELRGHPQVHRDYPETILVVKPNEEAVWWSETRFQITTIRPSGDPAHAHPRFPEGPHPAPDYPFTGASPIVTERVADPGGDYWEARSGVPKPAAHQHMYKISFRIEGDDIDPDAYCSN